MANDKPLGMGGCEIVRKQGDLGDEDVAVQIQCELTLTAGTISPEAAADWQDKITEAVEQIPGVVACNVSSWRW